jgi:hypothetical protein
VKRLLQPVSFQRGNPFALVPRVVPDLERCGVRHGLRSSSGSCFLFIKQLRGQSGDINNKSETSMALRCADSSWHSILVLYRQCDFLSYPSAMGAESASPLNGTAAAGASNAPTSKTSPHSQDDLSDFPFRIRQQLQLWIETELYLGSPENGHRFNNFHPESGSS